MLHLLYNATAQVREVIPGITEACFSWCQEQGAIHQSNIDISNLGIIAVSAFSLLMYQIFVEFEDELIDKTKIDADRIKLIRHALVFFAFILLVLFMGYYAWIN